MLIAGTAALIIVSKSCPAFVSASPNSFSSFAANAMNSGVPGISPCSVLISDCKFSEGNSGNSGTSFLKSFVSSVRPVSSAADNSEAALSNPASTSALISSNLLSNLFTSASAPQRFGFEISGID